METYITRNDFVPEKVPLALFESHPIASLKTGSGEVFTLVLGLSQEHVEALRKKSLDETDEAIQTLTSDPKRFGKGDYASWYEKGRVPFALVDRNNQLAALVWLGRETLTSEGDWHTIAYRSYAPYRGIGIMKALGMFIVSEYKKYYPEAQIWAAIDEKNPASAGLAKALGMTQDEALSKEKGKIIMVLK